MAYDHSKVGTLLFDEIEKAHPRVLDVFLQILDAARVTMASGETLELSGFHVVFTSTSAAATAISSASCARGFQSPPSPVITPTPSCSYPSSTLTSWTPNAHFRRCHLRRSHRTRRKLPSSPPRIPPRPPTRQHPCSLYSQHPQRHLPRPVFPVWILESFRPVASYRSPETHHRQPHQSHLQLLSQPRSHRSWVHRPAHGCGQTPAQFAPRPRLLRSTDPSL